jgi:tryptophan-rich sensory protein
MIENWPVLLAFIGVCILTASSGAIFTPGRWYEELDKPPWTPPNWAFGPAWTVIFALIAYSGYVFWMAAPAEARFFPLIIYGVQLALNAGWSALFFGLKRMDLALGDAILMLVAIAANMIAFYPYSPEAAWLLAPYLLWVSFASVLNYAILRRNTPRAQPT